MRHSQEDIFAGSEGNQWFERNKQALLKFDPSADIPLRLIDTYSLRPHRVLEVGAANGFRLAALAERFGAAVVALEPSAEAIQDGQTRFPNVEFAQGVASDIPLSEPFDLVIVNFIFHWIDRNRLLRSIAEIDRLVVDSGFLVIGDFFPSNLVKVEYHHLAKSGVYTYKQNYAATFLASGLYHPVCMMTAEHASKALTGQAAEDERIGGWLLQKKLAEHYIESRLHP